MKIKLSGKKEIFNFCKPYIIAEIGSNHNGDIELAKKLIRQAKEAGADCVKFQSWSKETIFSEKVYKSNYFLADDYRSREDHSLESIVEAYSVSEAELLELKSLADEIGIDCTSTPFSKKEVDFLVNELKTPFIKIASMDLNNYPFLDYVAKKNFPIVISTGLSSLDEIEKAIQTIEDAGNKQICILHCISIYPPDDNQVNLRNIQTLQTLYLYPIGFSDHTIGTSIPLASVALGACLIEKHFTLDKTMEGWDHKVSADFNELTEICSQSKRIADALGTTRITAQENKEKKDAFRRSIVTTRAIMKGEKISLNDIDFKRPGEGLSPGEIKYVVGRSAKRNLDKDSIIYLEDI
ncbi:N-acetylneuraminate synthase family protein [Vicingaceae bacterium]|nr:N-acetylneuraminate synthase family protein [Vicingaceae bacterium]